MRSNVFDQMFYLSQTICVFKNLEKIFSAVIDYSLCENMTTRDKLESAGMKFGKNSLCAESLSSQERL